jgi:hypothetical protein
MTIGDSVDDRDAPRVPFAPSTRAIVTAFVEAMGADDGPDGSREPAPLRAEKTTWIVDEVEQWSSSGSPSIRLGLRGLFWVVDLLPLFVLGLFSRASRLPLSERIAYYEAVEASPIGLLATALVGLKIPVVALLYEEGPELAETGFDRPSLMSLRVIAPPPAPIVKAPFSLRLPSQGPSR